MPPVATTDNARVAYQVLTQIARRLSATIRDRRPIVWVSHDELCRMLKDAGLKETSRSVITKLLKPIQTHCASAGLPDLSALIVKKPKGDQGNLIMPAPGWWDPYVEQGLATDGDVGYWFNRFKEARDYDWPDQPFW